MAKQTVGTSAVKLDMTAYSDQHKAGQMLVLQSLGTGDIYVDLTNAVTSSTGLKIAANASVTLTLQQSQDLWVIASASSTDLRYVALS